EETFVCYICYKEYTQEADLDYHYLMDHNISNSCHRCNLAFFNDRKLKKHTRKRHNIKHSGCIFCPEAFGGLMYRKKEHNKTQYQCIYCHNAFRTSTKLCNHLYIHKKPFNCLLCVMTFNTKSSMRLHLINKH
ncbi:Zinc finger protein 561, partial [Camponotus floridanus]